MALLFLTSGLIYLSTLSWPGHHFWSKTFISSVQKKALLNKHASWFSFRQLKFLMSIHRECSVSQIGTFLPKWKIHMGHNFFPQIFLIPFVFKLKNIPHFILFAKKWQSYICPFIQLRYFEKATKEKDLFLKLLRNVKTNGRFFQSFVAFSEYLNFNFLVLRHIVRFANISKPQ